jgi:hypothetical protein
MRRVAARGGALGRGRAVGRLVGAGAAVLAASFALAACGEPSADLFVVHRSGTIPGATLDMLVSDGGGVKCNDGDTKQMTSSDLILARKIARELNGKDDDHPGPATRDPELPARPGSILRYDIRSEKGSVAFSDNSLHQPAAFYLAQKFVRDMAIRVCGLPR